MKRLNAVILVCLCLCFCVLAACISREAAERAMPQPDQYTVTFQQGGAVVKELSVEEGALITDYPQDEVWYDEQGQLADFATLAVTRNMQFHVREPITVRTDHVRYLSSNQEFFHPDETVSRGQAAQIACSLVDPATTAVGGALFDDVQVGDQYYDSIRMASALGVMNGYADGTFRPNADVTRGEMVSMLCRLMSVDEMTALAFSDVTAEDWDMGSVAAATTEGWLTGYEDGNFYPDTPITRAETVVLINRALDRTPNKTAIDEICASSPYLDVPQGHWAYYDIVDVSFSNELLAYIMGEVPDARPGFILLGDDLCHVNAETLKLDFFEKGFHTVSDGLPTDGLYYVQENGYFVYRSQPGLQELDGSMFYVAQTDGPFATDYDYGYLHFGSNGRYTSGDEVVDGYVDQIMAPYIMGRTENLLNEAILRKAFDYITDTDFDYQSTRYGWVRGSTSWPLFTARAMFETHRGSCFYWAGAFLYLARRLGYQAYPICGGVFDNNAIHAWVMIDDEDGTEYIYDTELDWAFRTGAHGRTYRRPGTDMFKRQRGHTPVTYIFPGDTYVVPPMDTEDALGEQAPPDGLIWPSAIGGPAYMNVNGELFPLETTWTEQYDSAGNLVGYTVTATYEGTTYTTSISLAEMGSSPSPSPSASPSPSPSDSPSPSPSDSPIGENTPSPSPSDSWGGTTDTSPSPSTDVEQPTPSTDVEEQPTPSTDVEEQPTPSTDVEEPAPSTSIEEQGPGEPDPDPNLENPDGASLKPVGT